MKLDMKLDVPRRAVLETTEIFENILSFLPPRSIFGVQRVSHQWKNVIASSPTLQEKMFLRVQKKSPETWMLLPRTPSEDEKDELIAENSCRLVKVAADKEPEGWKYDSGGLGHLFTPAALNPFLSLKDAGDPVWKRAQHWKGEAAMLTSGTKFAQHSSYRGTYFCDPPSKECSIRITYHAGCALTIPGGWIERVLGVSWCLCQSIKEMMARQGIMQSVQRENLRD